MKAARSFLPAQYSIWLLPAATHEALLAETVARLSTLLRGPAFVPHVTVQGDIALPKERLATALGMLARRIPAQCWKVQAVEHTPHFFRCLYLRLAAGPAFADLQAAAQRCTRTRKGLSPYPHLSLAYGDPHPGNATLARTVATEFDGAEILFDRLALYRSSRQVPIAQWEPLYTFPMGARRVRHSP